VCGNWCASLSAGRQIPPVPRAAVAADFDQPLDAERDLLAEVAFDPALLLDHAGDLPDVVFRQVLHADVAAHFGRCEDVPRAFPADSIDIRESNLDPLRTRKIDACNTCHIVIPAAACASDSGK